jgi:death-on-curing protein
VIVWITKSLALAIHERQLAEHAGASGIRDEALLESALAGPQQLYVYGDPPPDLVDLAARLAAGLVRNHAFVDGDKRTAHVCYRVFLALNDQDLRASEDEKYAYMLGLADGTLSQEQFGAWLREHLVSIDKNQVNESKAAYRRKR